MFPSAEFKFIDDRQLNHWIRAVGADAVGALGSTLLDVLASFVPAYAWVISVSLLGGLGFLWTISFRRVGKYSQSAA